MPDATVLDPQYIPPAERPGHEQPHGGDPYLASQITDEQGRAWLAIGDPEADGLATTDPRRVER